MAATVNQDRPIVVGVDGSEGAAHALDWALREAVVRHAPLHVILAWSPPEPISAIGSVLAPIEPEPYERQAKEVLERVIDDAVGRAGPGAAPVIVPLLTRGYPPKVLLDATDGAQLLVVGSRGLGGLRELLMGSVSHTCAQRSTIPVVVVPARVADPTSRAGKP
jgi:nucleotide-binding universal stress UspA family protein